jgi:hypothetical protein
VRCCLAVMSGILLPICASLAGAQASIRLREPDGPYAVGRRTLTLVDSTRREIATPAPDDRREITINVWYPIPKGTQAEAPYMPNVDKYRGVVSDQTLVRWANVVSPVKVDAAPAPGPFPILLFSHGWGSRSASSSVWLSAVASRGFVVIGVDHPFMGIVATSAPTAPSNRDDQFASPRYSDLYYADDLQFVRGYLTILNSTDAVLRSSIRADVVFAAGHSSGHAAASAFAAVYGGVKALISFDAGVSLWARERGLSVPLLLVRAERPTYTGVFVREPGDTRRGTLYDSTVVRRIAGPLFDLQILGTGHGAILDNVAELTGPSGAVIRAGHEVIIRHTVAFLESVLTGTPSLSVDAQDAARVRLRRVSLSSR